MKFTTNSQRILYELFNQEFNESSGEMSESSYFEFFSAQQVMKSFDLSDEEIENSVMGAGNDGGCDPIFLIHNGTLIREDSLTDLVSGKNATIDLIIIQAKRETSFSEDAIMKWKATAQNLMEIGVEDSIYATRYNEDVRNAFGLFRDLYVKTLRNVERLRIQFVYSSFSVELHPNVRQQADELTEAVKNLFPGPQIKVTVEFWDADRLLNEAQKQPETRISLPLAEAPINIGAHHDFVALVNLAKYYHFITDSTGELRKYIFESNVRDYQGHNSVNQDIQDSLEQHTVEDFWWLNNGITLLTEEASLATNKELVLKEPEVVNGCQTSNEIFQYFKRNPEALETDNRNVLIRIIVPEREEIRDRIILATNNQTSILKSSLRVNDPIHWQIEMYFKGRGLYYDRRKNFYKNQGIKSANIVSVSFLAQCMISLLLQKPNYARARPSTLLTDDVAYEKLYGNNTDFDVFYNAASLGKKVDSVLKKIYSQAEKNDILFYVIYLVVAKEVQRDSIRASDIKALDLETITEQIIADVAQQVYEVYSSLGKTGKIAKGPELIKALKELVISNVDSKTAVGDVAQKECVALTT